MGTEKGNKQPQKKSHGGLIVIAAAVLVIAALILFNYFNNRVQMSTSSSPGNTAGNLYNGGLFCENGGTIFFSNPNDEFTLYSMNSDLTGFKKLYNDYARYINADENYVYYTRKNNKKENGTQSIFTFYSTGVYRLTRNGKNIAVINQEPTGSLLLYKNRLYYQIYNNNSLELHCVGIDKSDDRVITKGDAAMVAALNDKIYFSGHPDNQNIYTIGSSGNRNLLMETNAYMPIAMENGIYYVNTSDSYKLYFTDYEGADRECIIDTAMSWYNITEDGRYIFYQYDHKKKSGLFMYDTETKASVKITDGNYKWICIAGGYCFFFDYDGESAYAYNYTTGVLNIFNPPVLK